MDKISEEKIIQNKERFLNLVESISRKGANINELKDYLEKSDFFEAPASTKYHCSFKGGLCQHSLNVYDNLVTLATQKNLINEVGIESLIIVGLFHDFSKTNFYVTTSKNRKVYSESGSKYDELGRFDWITEIGYAIKDQDDRFLYGNHEETSEYMLRKFIPLYCAESAAILCHHGGMGYDSASQTAPKIMTRYKLAALLHLADMLATYFDEGKDGGN